MHMDNVAVWTLRKTIPYLMTGSYSKVGQPLFLSGVSVQVNLQPGELRDRFGFPQRNYWPNLLL